MAATLPLARSLHALTCFALLFAACNAHNNRRQNVNNCAEYLSGQATDITEVLDPVITPGYEVANTISNGDHCALLANSADTLGCERLAVGSLIKACDYFGLFPPIIASLDIFTQIVKCNGSCPEGLVVTVTQYCNV